MRLLAVVAVLLGLGCSSSKCADAVTCEGGGTMGGAASGGSTATAGQQNGGNNSGGSSAGGKSPTAGQGPQIECPPECLVATTCVKQCGGKPVSVGCCPCVAPAFDARQCD